MTTARMAPERDASLAPADQFPRVALLADYLEEGWTSMDLVADMLAAELPRADAPVAATLLRPAMRRRFSGASARSGAGFTADRVLARFVDYPRWLRPRVSEFDVFHVLDHSYAHLALALPEGRVVMNCHDVDAFRSVLEPERDPRSAAYRAMSARILSGFRRAARVLCISSATRDAILAHDLLPADRVEVAYLGVHPSCTMTPHAHADAAAAGLLGAARPDAPELLHVGSTIARKRIDVLLHTFAAVRSRHEEARLVRAGGPLTDSQQQLAERLGIAGSIVTLPHVSRDVLAAVYRRAAVVLQPSDAEGFGLPVAEAMSCGTPVVASDLPVLREAGGEEAMYAPVGVAAGFAGAVLALLDERERDPDAWRRRRERGVAWASRFSWHAYAERASAAYRRTWDEAVAAARGRA
jgi:glycosyltransferase involved in cell wall biosynthesis